MKRIVTMALAAAMIAAASGHASAAGCATNPNGLGVARTVEIDTTAGPGFGLEHYKAHDFLEPHEVVLTFDDGPQVNTTKAILAALNEHCAKATFFSIGKMAIGLPEIIREVARHGHTIGTHTWSHARLRRLKTDADAISEIERGFSAVHRATGTPIAPFFRYPVLEDTKATIAHLGERNIAIFSTDIDSRDYVPQSPERLVKSVIDKLERKGKGIILMHDIQKTTAKAMPMLLRELKAKGYKLVHLTAKDKVTTLAEYDAIIEKDVKGLPSKGSERATSSVVKTIQRSE